MGKNPRNSGFRFAFTLVELMMVATIMIMVAGVLYSVYVNLSGVYIRGSENMLLLQDVQNTMEVMLEELRDASQILKLSSDEIIFQRYYDIDKRFDSDSVSDMNKILVKTVGFRLHKSDAGVFSVQKKEENNPWQTLNLSFHVKQMNHLQIFTGWQFDKGFYSIYDERKKEPRDVALIRIHFDIPTSRNSVNLFRKIVMPIIYGNLPVTQEEAQQELTEETQAE